MEDEMIVELILSQDVKGLELLELRYGSFLRYIVRSILSEFPEDIEECVNDLWLKFWDIMPEFDRTKSSLKTFISHVARNAALDRRRELLRKSRRIETKENGFFDQDLDIRSNPTEEYVLNQEKGAQLKKVLHALPPKEMNLFLRKYYYLQTAEQIASETGQSRRAVESKLARIKKKLANALKEVR